MSGIAVVSLWIERCNPLRKPSHLNSVSSHADVEKVGKKVTLGPSARPMVSRFSRTSRHLCPGRKLCSHGWRLSRLTSAWLGRLACNKHSSLGFCKLLESRFTSKSFSTTDRNRLGGSLCSIPVFYEARAYLQDGQCLTTSPVQLAQDKQPADPWSQCRYDQPCFVRTALRLHASSCLNLIRAQ